MNEKQRKLIELLKDMFQLNQTDLDFGIYRIMNQKADEITQFLEKDLIKSIKEAFNGNNNDSLQKELDELCSNIKNAGMNPDDSPKVKELKENIANSSNKENDENEIYSYLTNFFSRYYKDGDFVSLRRYKKDTYAIPYEGEEVKLHWANSDQYYIKTSEFFRDYAFVVKDKKFHFKIVDADTENNNNKADSDKERRFVIDEETPIYEENGEIYIRFEYKAVGKEVQTKLNEKSLGIIFSQENSLLEPLKELVPTPNNKTRTILEKHLTDYTSRNSFDYFIHKDLKGFLSRELDFYIKNEILYVDDILESTTSKIESSLNKIKTFKKIGNKVIAFLSQLENFQKKLWLKKKFIIDTNYCITLDKIDESFYQDILSNVEQLKEWKELFNVDVRTIDDLKEEKFLVLDTKFFDVDFKDKLLSKFDDLDEQCDGILLNGDNFSGLNLLENRYKHSIDCIYIDPPYNSKSSEIIYKNNYKHSSFNTFIENRINKSIPFLKNAGIYAVAIDDYETHNIRYILDSLFGEENRLGTNVIIHNPGGRQDDRFFPTSHEYMYAYSNNKEECYIDRLEISEEKKKEYKHLDNYGKYKLREYRRSGSNSRRVDGPGLWYSIFYNPDTADIKLESADGYIEIKPIDNDGVERCWRWGKDTFILKKEKYIDISLGQNGHKIQVKEREIDNEGEKAKTIWNKTKYSAVNGTNFLKNIFPNDGLKRFDYSKSPFLMLDTMKLFLKTKKIVLDFFGGSGTTAHAVINLNREDNIKRKYITIEMGEYFNSATKPRIQKVIYTNNWKDGKPQDKNGISQIFKYFKLESYEDSLNNLAFKKTNKDLFDHDVKEDYLLNYMLDYETNESLLNIDAFKTPFDYKLNIATSSAGETVETNVDLVETFNYLIGLKIKSRQKIKGFLVIEGENLKEEKILIIWRNGQSNDELNAFFSKMDFSVYDREFETIYINGDNNLANLKKDEEHFKVKLIEEEFKLRMFGE